MIFTAFYTRRCTRRPPAGAYETSHSFLTNLFLSIAIISTAFVTGAVLVFCHDCMPELKCCAEPSVGLNRLLEKFGLALSIKTCLVKQEYLKPRTVNGWTRVSLTQNVFLSPTPACACLMLHPDRGCAVVGHSLINIKGNTV